MELVLRAHQTTIIDKLRAGFAAASRAQVLYGPCAFGKTEGRHFADTQRRRKGKRSAMVMIAGALHSDKRQIAQIPHRSWSADGWVGDVQARSGHSNLHRSDTRKARGISGCGFADHRRGALYAQGNRRIHPQQSASQSHRPVRLAIHKGMGAVYSSVESAVTIDQLVDQGWLIRPRVFIAQEINMAGARIAGEWSAAETESAGFRSPGILCRVGGENARDIRRPA